MSASSRRGSVRLLLVLCAAVLGAAHGDTGRPWSQESAELQSVVAELQQLAARVSRLAGRLDRETEQCGPRRLPRDCSQLPEGAVSGVHLLQLGSAPSQPAVAAYCDLESDGGGWTVIQRRADISPRQEFYLGWAAYREGFGELDAEFWWGLEPLWQLTATRDRRFQLRIDMEDFEGARRHAVYGNFRVASEADGYRLSVANFSGDAGDGLTHHSGARFSTRDRDQDAADGASCAEAHKGAWWYVKCHASNLNGRYLSGQHESYADGVGWFHFRGHHYSLKTVTMKIRPSDL